MRLRLTEKSIEINHFKQSFFRSGFETMANVLKSVIISLAVLDRHVSVEEAVSLSRLEQEYQVSNGRMRKSNSFILWRQENFVALHVD